MVSSLIISFALTMLIEYAVVKLFFIKRKVFLYVLLVNLLTNPLVVFLYNVMFLFNFKLIFPITIILEILVFIVEGIVYKHLLNIKMGKAMLVSFIANVSAYLMGEIISAIIF